MTYVRASLAGRFHWQWSNSRLSNFVLIAIPYTFDRMSSINRVIVIAQMRIIWAHLWFTRGQLHVPRVRYSAY